MCTKANTKCGTQWTRSVLYTHWTDRRTGPAPDHVRIYIFRKNWNGSIASLNYTCIHTHIHAHITVYEKEYYLHVPSSPTEYIAGEGVSKADGEDDRKWTTAEDWKFIYIIILYGGTYYKYTYVYVGRTTTANVLCSDSEKDEAGGGGDWCDRERGGGWGCFCQLRIYFRVVLLYGFSGRTGFKPYIPINIHVCKMWNWIIIPTEIGYMWTENMYLDY